MCHLANLCAIAGVKALVLPVEDLLVEMCTSISIIVQTERHENPEALQHKMAQLGEVCGPPGAPLASPPELPYIFAYKYVSPISRKYFLKQILENLLMSCL